MPISYNFHTLLATFYIILGTNLLIQCPVPVPVFCPIFDSQKIHIKRSPNAIKIYRDFFGIYVIFGNWNQRKRRLTLPTTHQDTSGGPGARWWVVASSNVNWSYTSGARKLISRKKSC
jgi:hypothetical protein